MFDLAAKVFAYTRMPYYLHDFLYDMIDRFNIDTTGYKLSVDRNGGGTLGGRVDVVRKHLILNLSFDSSYVEDDRYIILHELAHIIQINTGRFSLTPDYSRFIFDGESYDICKITSYGDEHHNLPWELDANRMVVKSGVVNRERLQIGTFQKAYDSGLTSC